MVVMLYASLLSDCPFILGVIVPSSSVLLNVACENFPSSVLFSLQKTGHCSSIIFSSYSYTVIADIIDLGLGNDVYRLVTKKNHISVAPNAAIIAIKQIGKQVDKSARGTRYFAAALKR